jgi:hypothetical protein
MKSHIYNERTGIQVKSIYTYMSYCCTWYMHMSSMHVICHCFAPHCAWVIDSTYVALFNCLYVHTSICWHLFACTHVCCERIVLLIIIITGAVQLVRDCRAQGLKTAVGSSAEQVKVKSARRSIDKDAWIMYAPMQNNACFAGQYVCKARDCRLGDCLYSDNRVLCTSFMYVRFAMSLHAQILHLDKHWKIT